MSRTPLTEQQIKRLTYILDLKAYLTFEHDCVQGYYETPDVIVNGYDRVNDEVLFFYDVTINGEARAHGVDIYQEDLNSLVVYEDCGSYFTILQTVDITPKGLVLDRQYTRPEQKLTGFQQDAIIQLLGKYDILVPSRHQDTTDNVFYTITRYTEGDFFSRCGVELYLNKEDLTNIRFVKPLGELFNAKKGGLRGLFQ